MSPGLLALGAGPMARQAIPALPELRRQTQCRLGVASPLHISWRTNWMFSTCSREGLSMAALMVTWVVGLGHWSDGMPSNPFPYATTQAGFTAPPGHCAASNAVLGQLQAFVVGNWGAVSTTHVSGAGHWTDGRDGNPDPQRLSRALWMFDWVQWPH